MNQPKSIKRKDTIELVHRLRNEGMEAVAEIYKIYRNEFLGFSQKYFPNVPRDILLQTWHDTVIVFYEICLANKYDPERSKLKTFLFSIGKNQLLNRLKKEHPKGFISIEEEGIIKDPNLVVEAENELDEETLHIRRALKNMGKKCRQIIRLVYYHQYSAEAIKEEMNYENTNVVYSHKSRCLKKLKQIMTETIKQ